MSKKKSGQIFQKEKFDQAKEELVGESIGLEVALKHWPVDGVPQGEDRGDRVPFFTVDGVDELIDE